MPLFNPLPCLVKRCAQRRSTCRDKLIKPRQRPSSTALALCQPCCSVALKIQQRNAPARSRRAVHHVRHRCARLREAVACAYRSRGIEHNKHGIACVGWLLKPHQCAQGRRLSARLNIIGMAERAFPIDILAGGKRAVTPAPRRGECLLITLYRPLSQSVSL